MEGMLQTEVPFNASFYKELNSSFYNDQGTNSTNETYDGVDEPSDGFSVADLIILTFTPGTVVFGTIGNILCACVLFRARFRCLGVNMYLLALAAADTSFLWTNSMTRNFIQLNFGIDYSTVSSESCKAYVYLLYTSKCVSAWLTVAVTLERLIVVLFPHKARNWCTRKKALVAVGVVTFMVSATFSFIPFLYDIAWKEESNYYRCEMIRHYKEKQADVILKTLDLLIYSLFPTIILTVSNAILIYKLVQSAKFRAKTTQRELQDNVARRLTVTLTLVSGCFLLCTVPMSSFLVHAQIHTRVDNFEIYYRSFYVLELLNSAVNFILYCASGPTFRKEMKEVMIMCRRCRKKRAATIQSALEEIGRKFSISSRSEEISSRRFSTSSGSLGATESSCISNGIPSNVNGVFLLPGYRSSISGTKV